MQHGGDYLDGKKHGPWVQYYATGAKRSEGSYDRGRKVGRWLLYHKNGELQSEATFVDGFYSGYYCAYQDNGHKFREGYYNEFTGKSSADGTKTGIWRGYDVDGKVESEQEYRRGSKVKAKAPA